MTAPPDRDRRAGRFWSDSAAQYDSRDHGSEHDVAVEILSAHITQNDWKSLLDVGCGTGRHLARLRESHPQLKLVGVEPAHDMLRQAQQRSMSAWLIEADGARLPFPDRTFDAVTEFAVLHHVYDPALIVTEMLRVARFAVFLSDTNRYGNGRSLFRVIKLTARQLGIWPIVYWLNTRGRGYYTSDGDGVSYSYSVFDSVRMCSRWGRTQVVATRPRDDAHPLLGASHALLIAIRS